MSKRSVTPAYVVFYILFHPDTWRILMGVIISLLLTPRLVTPELSSGGVIMLHVMIAAIGWAVTAKPADLIIKGLKRLFLGGKAR